MRIGRWLHRAPWITPILAVCACGSRTGLSESASPLEDASPDGGVQIEAGSEARAGDASTPGSCPDWIVDETASRIAVDQTSVYWLAGDPSGVVRVPKCGGTPEAFAADDNASQSAFALDEANVYWADGSGAVLMKSKTGGALITVASDPAIPTALAVDTVSVYWTNAKGVAKAPLTGGPVSTLASGTGVGFGIAVDDASVYWQSISPDEKSVEVLSEPKEGGTVVTLARTRESSIGPTLVVDATSVYWAFCACNASPPGQLFSVPKSGGTMVTLATTEACPIGVAIDAMNLYSTEATCNGGGIGQSTATSTIRRTPKAGGNSAVIVSAQAWPLYIAVDDTSIYWTNEGTLASDPVPASVRRASK
jgi:hypothetical protein